MTSKTSTTTNHDEIREWVEQNGGKPAGVKATAEGQDPGVLQALFPGGAGEESLEQISWENWFEKFEKNKLAFLYQTEKANGGPSTFFKVINR
ncbi:hypothetical protein [Arthrobacter sp. CG_A4]|uniref:hypothetical protein n=1 Tax=Arthrobacter sp. CG_A4 TaxID=3071706 RepID=UPI002E06A27F|nr:hypothetical protein [Arthrobacter sp. CG_A4]